MKSDEQAFFEGMDTWKPEQKRSLLDRLRGNNKTEYKTCVFVAEGEAATVKRIPVDSNSQLLKNPETGEVYLKPLKGEIYFFDKHKALPLYSCPDVIGEYDIPEHLALKFYNLGFGEAELSGYKALIEKINQWQAIVTISWIVAAIIVVLNAYMMKEMSGAITDMSVKAAELIAMYGV